MLLPLKPPSSQLGIIQPYLEERNERVASGSRRWRSLEKIFWLREKNIYCEKLAGRLRKKSADLQLLLQRA